jgi:hypothetical protein
MNKIQPQLGAEAVRQEKHIELFNEIMNLKGVIKHAGNLFDRICGPTPEDPENIKTSEEPTLSNVLETGAGNIRSSIDSLHSILDQIEKNLF